MNYSNILGMLVKGQWLITPEKHWAMLSVLEGRMTGAMPQATLMGDDEEYDSDESIDGDYLNVGSAAIIPVHGILGKHLSSMEMACGGCSMDAVAGMLDVADNDSNVSLIVMDFRTPGGTVAGTPELAAKIADVNSRKQVVAWTDSECCSAGLYLASQCGLFYATGSAQTGSCGVRMILLDESKALDEAGIKVNPIFSGKYKLSGASFKPLEKDEREMFQKQSDDIHEQFKQAVNTNRSVDEKFLQGQCFSGEEAARIGMVDGLCDDLDELLDLLNQPS